jgi:hypothetical protein
MCVPTACWLAVGLFGTTPSAGVAAERFPALFELSSLQRANGGDGTSGMMMHGADTNPSPLLYADVAGRSVALTGDINGDGVGDMVIGAYRAFPTETSYGAAYVVFGSADGFPAELQLGELLPQYGGDGTRGFVCAGDPDVGAFGYVVSEAGDVNADGLDDFIVGAPSSFGRAYLIFGSPSGFPPLFEAASLLPENGGDGSAGVVFDGRDAQLDAGDGVRAIGDVNGDGIDDLAIGAPNEHNHQGATYVVFGRSEPFPAFFELGGLLPEQGGDGTEGIVIFGPANGRIGYGPANSGGDINGDGINELVVGANQLNETYVLWGRTQWPAMLELDAWLSAPDADGSAGFILRGIEPGDAAGAATSAGDINGDGYDDIAIGAHRAEGDAFDVGEGYVVFGRAEPFAPEFELADLLPANGGDGSEGFVVYGVDRADLAALPLSSAGDINGDGLNDLIIGARYAGEPDPGEFEYAGQAYLVFGQRSFPPELQLSSLLPERGGDGTMGVVFDGIEERDYTGAAVSPSGDVNGDGIADLLIGAPQGWSPYYGHVAEGRAFVIFGRLADQDDDGVADAQDNCTEILNSDQRDTDKDGYGNVCDPDLNNDGIVNFKDLGLLKGVFFETDPDADFNGDGRVNMLDLGTMKAFFFSPPGPSGLTP